MSYKEQDSSYDWTRDDIAKAIIFGMQDDMKSYNLEIGILMHQFEAQKNETIKANIQLEAQTNETIKANETVQRYGLYAQCLGLSCFILAITLFSTL